MSQRSLPVFDDCLKMAARTFVLAAIFFNVTLTYAANPKREPLSQNSSHLNLEFANQTETSAGSGIYHRIETKNAWAPQSTALILCDVWDAHHCKRAVERLEEMIPRLNALTEHLRKMGVTVIHAPSDCMEFYKDSQARRRALKTPATEEYPSDIEKWCYQIPSEEKGKYPIDQSDGGEDDTPEEHQEWINELTHLGLDPKRPWKRQHPGIRIDQEKDFVSDQGKEIWNILTQGKIDNVILAGVHTNMCILGRPFGLRRMVQGGKNVTLVRDMTDTMYNPKSAPFVSHFTGTDLIIDHIERYVCPTISSEQILGGHEFRFLKDVRPTIVFMIGEDEYETHKTLPAFSLSHLGNDYRVRFVFGSDTDSKDFPGLKAINDADILAISVRRRPILSEQLQLVRDFEASGKPMLGIRTASHAFHLRKLSDTPAGVESWPEFDRQVWGGNYTNHHPNDASTWIKSVGEKSKHPILTNWPVKPMRSMGSLYKVQPLAPNTNPLITGTVRGAPTEPVLWTFTRANGGKSVYTSLGHKADFEIKEFPSLLKASIEWLLHNDEPNAQ